MSSPAILAAALGGSCEVQCVFMGVSRGHLAHVSAGSFPLIAADHKADQRHPLALMRIDAARPKMVHCFSAFSWPQGLRCAWMADRFRGNPGKKWRESRRGNAVHLPQARLMDFDGDGQPVTSQSYPAMTKRSRLRPGSAFLPGHSKASEVLAQPVRIIGGGLASAGDLEQPTPGCG